jgi:hypothetical protein
VGISSTKAPWSAEACSFDEEQVEPVLAGFSGFGPWELCDKGVRGSFVLLAFGRKRRREGRRLRDSSIGKPTRNRRRSLPRQKTVGTWANVPKLAAQRQVRATRVVGWGLGSNRREASVNSAPSHLEIRTLGQVHVS